MVLTLLDAVLYTVEIYLCVVNLCRIFAFPQELRATDGLKSID